MSFPKDLETKILISEAAVQSREQSGALWQLSEISEISGIPVSEIFLHFPSKRSMLDFWYQSLPMRYQYMIAELDGYEELTLSEKLSNFMLTILDMMSEKEQFVAKSFDPIVFKNQNWHPFKKEVANVFKEIIENHNGVSQAARVVLWDEFFEFLGKEFLFAIKFHIKDSSEHREKTTALIDKLSNFIADILCNRVVDSGIDLIRFFWQEGIIKVDVNVPFIGRIKSGSNKQA
jgi:AcrR family transcriptional regulator